MTEEKRPTMGERGRNVLPLTCFFLTFLHWRLAGCENEFTSLAASCSNQFHSLRAAHILQEGMRLTLLKIESLLRHGRHIEQSEFDSHASSYAEGCLYRLLNLDSGGWNRGFF